MRMGPGWCLPWILGGCVGIGNVGCGGSGSSPTSGFYLHPTLVAAAGEPIEPEPTTPSGSYGPPFAVTPALPDGLAVDPATGTLSGTPTLEAPTAVYTVTAQSAEGKAASQVQITVKPAGTVLHKLLACRNTPQEHSLWCCFASAACVLEYLGHPVPQCQLYNSEWGINYACEQQPFDWQDRVANYGVKYIYGPAPSISHALASQGVSSIPGGPLTFAEIQSEINRDRPFIFWRAFPTENGHCSAGIGWDLRHGENEVYVMNPWITAGIQRLRYQNLLAGRFEEWSTTYTWTETLTIP